MAATQNPDNQPSSSHRLPTISAVDALRTQQDDHRNAFSTGLRALDTFLGSENHGQAEGQALVSGLIRGHVYEAYGPPGSGKTTFGMQVASSALQQGLRVCWIDTSHRVPIHRLQAVLSKGSAPDTGPSPATEELLGRVDHYTVPTLAHLIALLGHRSPSFPPAEAGLIVVDTVSAPFATAFPRALEEQPGGLYGARKNDALNWAAARRWALMGDLAARIAQLAAVRDTAVLLLSQTSSKMRTEYGTLLRPALSTRAWLEGISTRLVLFRDFSSGENRPPNEQPAPARYIGVVKHTGALHESLEHVFPFLIDKSGMHQIAATGLPSIAPPQLEPAPSAKRKRDEVADSQSEDEGGRDPESEPDWRETDQARLWDELTESDPLPLLEEMQDTLVSTPDSAHG